jgi:phosphoribosyl-dephospho-CoA transferase
MRYTILKIYLANKKNICRGTRGEGMFYRHDLAVLSPTGREQAVKNMRILGIHRENTVAEKIKDLILGGKGVAIPGIVRRWDPYTEKMKGVPIGFTTPFLVEENRPRIASVVMEDEIEKIITPFELSNIPFETRNNCLSSLREILNLDQEGRVGIWGSAALEVFTGLFYTHAFSDLDLVIENFSFAGIQHFCAEIENISRKWGLRIDIEIRLENGWGINAKELLSSAKDILAKSLRDIDLISKEEIIKMLG